ncbi:MAG: hypothetical protein VX346_19615 [Planctomycetota bacterium]|nr:hypothetical protein [Planctomycetota bacterium]
MSDHPEISEERLTAYFDGELPPEEYEAIEAFLDSPQGQQIQSGNQALRDLLQQLPPQRLPAGFSQRVIEEAQRRAGLVDKPVDVPVRAVPGSRQRPRELTQMAWRGLALTASLALVIWLGWGGDRRSAQLDVGSGRLTRSPAASDVAQVLPNAAQTPAARSDSAPADDLLRVKHPTGKAAFAENRSWLLLVYEIAVTPTGSEQKVIQRALTKSGIALVENDIKVSSQLEQALFESKFLSGVRVEEPSTLAGRSRSKVDDEIRLIYAAATAGAIERVYQTLKSKNREIAAMRMSIAMEPRDPATIAHQRLVQSLQPRKLMERLGQARRLAFDTLLLTRSARIFSQTAFLPAASADGNPRRIPLQPGLPLGDGKNMPSEVLLVVHYLKQDLRRADP